MQVKDARASPLSQAGVLRPFGDNTHSKFTVESSEDTGETHPVW